MVFPGREILCKVIEDSAFTYGVAQPDREGLGSKWAGILKRMWLSQEILPMWGMKEWHFLSGSETENISQVDPLWSS